MQQRGRRAGQVPHGHFGLPDQLPAAGAGARVHARKAPRQRHGPRRNARARAGAARHVKHRIAPAQIGKARRKARKGHLPGLRRVAGDDLRRAQAQMRGHFGQVFAVVAHGNLHQRPGRFFRRAAFCCTLCLLRNGGHGGGQLCIVQAPRLVMNQQRARGRNNFGHALGRASLQRAQQRQRAGQIGQLDKQSACGDGEKSHAGKKMKPG